MKRTLEYLEEILENLTDLFSSLDDPYILGALISIAALIVLWWVFVLPDGHNIPLGIEPAQYATKAVTREA